jgi:hypothetical protein
VLIDCDSCEMRDIACDDCVVGALINQQDVPGPGEPGTGRDATGTGQDVTGGDRDRPREAGELRTAGDAAEADGTGRPGPEIGEPERRALRTLASAGLVPPLRLVLPDPVPPQGRAPQGRARQGGARQGGARQGGARQGKAPQRGAHRDAGVPDAEAS